MSQWTKARWRLTATGCLLAFLLVGKGVIASQLVPIPLAALMEKSNYVVLGQIVELSSRDPWSDKAQIKIVSVLKGSYPKDNFRMHINWSGPKGFDPQMKKGDSAIFFLKSIENGEATIAYPSAIAVFRGPWLVE